MGWKKIWKVLLQALSYTGPTWSGPLQVPFVDLKGIMNTWKAKLNLLQFSNKYVNSTPYKKDAILTTVLELLLVLVLT